MDLAAKIEAVLFFRGEPTSQEKLAELLETDQNSLENALKTLEMSLGERGIRLMRNGEDVELRTAPEASSLIETLTKEEFTRDIGKAGLETLAIVLYKGPISRSEIDYIRGVNSNFILRNLLVRGLVEKVPGTSNERSFTYRATFELLAYLGVSAKDELPEYADIQKELAQFVKDTEKEMQAAQPPTQTPTQP